MPDTAVDSKAPLAVSQMAENLIGSEIIKLAAEINEKIKKGEHIYNYTIGDFDPAIFPIPDELNREIVDAYHQHQTNYPAANGIAALRNAVSSFLKEREGLEYPADEILISGGARPLIYATYLTLIDPGNRVIVPVPSWNNNHYCHLSSAQAVYIETKPENDFMPTADEIRPHLKNTTLLALCSPLNPTGTVFKKEQLEQICDMVLEENARRGADEKPLYLMYDQIYWVLTFGKTRHFNPVSLRPEMKKYTLFVDGISKSLAATGVRVGWAFGPKKIIDKMRAILSHVGAWAPRAEQVATARYLEQKDHVTAFVGRFKKEIELRLDLFYKGFMDLRQSGFDVDAIAPQAAIYLTVKLNLKGRTTRAGKVLASQNDVTKYILDEAKVAIVPFSAFGSSPESPWYRLSVGTCNANEISGVFDSLKKAMGGLS
jgi:aspartate aminotransferase